MNNSLQERTINWYDANAAGYVQARADLDMSPEYAAFLDLLPAGTSILDLGCGGGRDLKAFLAAGRQAAGMDASAAMVAICRDQGLPATQGVIQDISDTAIHGGVWASASLLHVPAGEIPGVLQRISRLLVAGGILYCSLKEAENPPAGYNEVIERDGRHYTYWTPNGWTTVCATAAPDLHPLRFWRTGDRLAGRAPWMNFLFRRI